MDIYDAYLLSASSYFISVFQKVQFNSYNKIMSNECKDGKYRSERAFPILRAFQ